jgi:hypothetical protein
MCVGPSGDLVVLSSPGRVTFFDGTTRAYRRDFSVQSALYTAFMFAYDDDGFLYIKDTDGRAQPGEAWRFQWLKVDSLGTEVERFEIPYEDPAAERFYLIFPEGRRSNFVVETRAAWSPHGYMVVGRNDHYAIELRRPDGTVRVTRDAKPVRLNREERAQWQVFAEKFGAGGTSYPVPEEKPVFRDLFVDPDGRILVARYVEGQEVDLGPPSPGDDRPRVTWREPTTLDIFSDGGEFLGTVAFPLFSWPAAFRGNHVWGVADTDEGQQLIRWEIDGLELFPQRE